MNSAVKKTSEISIDVYQGKVWGLGKMILLFPILISIGFLMNYPVKESLTNALNQQLSVLARKGCPISVKDVGLGLYPLGLKLNKISLAGQCFKSTQSLVLSSLNLGLVAPSISPLGLKFQLNTKLNKSKIITNGIIATDQIILNLDGTSINISDFSHLHDKIESLEGVFKVNSLVKLDPAKGKILSADIRLDSGNFNLKPLTFMINNVIPFTIPGIKIGDANLQMSIDKRMKVTIDGLKLGDRNSQLGLDMAGDLAINERSINSSQLKLKGKFHLGPGLKKQFSYAKGYLDRLARKGDFYMFELSGTFGNPKIQ